MKKEYIKPLLWGAAGGAIVLLIVFFSFGWIMWSGSAEKMAAERASEVIKNELAPIVVAVLMKQYQENPDFENKLNKLKEVDSWKREKYVEENYSIKIPGTEEPSSEIMDAVLNQVLGELNKLIEK